MVCCAHPSAAVDEVEVPRREASVNRKPFRDCEKIESSADASVAKAHIASASILPPFRDATKMSVPATRTADNYLNLAIWR